MAKTAVKKGMEGIVVTDSEICSIDGKKGTLRYRGIDVGELATHSTYEETVYLLWFGELPNQSQLTTLRDRLAEEREVDDAVWDLLAGLPDWLQPMEALSTAVSVLSCNDPESNDDSETANVNKAIRLVAKMPTIMANFQRRVEGKSLVHPNPNLNHAENFLYMLRGGEKVTKLEARAMDQALVLMAEHELNASTFAARVTASTLSDMYSAIISALGTLKGPLHGGANQRAMKMLVEIGNIDNVEPYITAALEAKKRIMGFGHRLYKVIDPRAIYLRQMLTDICVASEDPKWGRLAQNVAEVVEEKKGLYPNVDFFSAPLFYMMGIPIHLFTPIFAMSRVAGWTAHVMEQYAHNRLLRPVSAYVGPETKPYVPMSNRNGQFVNDILS